MTDNSQVVLIVEDEASIADLLAQIVSRQHFRVHSTNNLKEAREVIATTKLDIIFLDLKLPDGLGVEIIDYIKEQNPDAYIIVMSAYYHYRDKLLQSGVDIASFLNKPFKQETVIEKLDEFRSENG